MSNANENAGARPPSNSGERGKDHAQPARVEDVARLAHELRTPLAAISVLAEIMRDERLGPLGSERYRGYAADIHESAAHANLVLAAFLEPGTAADGMGGPPEFVELDVAALTAGAVSALTPVADAAGVDLAATTEVGLPRVIADRRCLRQILNNLIANALKFTPPGGQVRVAVSYLQGGPVEIEVADTGDGMAPAELERIGAGAAVNEALRRRSGGTGIGIPLVRALAAACGATFTIQSSLGKGTCAKVSFPHGKVVLS